MSDIENVLRYFELAESAFENKDYINAAIYFRKCYYNYEYGELPIYIKEIDEKGHEAYNRYNDIKNNYLSKYEKLKIQQINSNVEIEDEDIAVNSENFLPQYCNWSKNRFKEEDI